MVKKKKEKTGRVVLISKEDNVLLKQYLLDIDSIGVTLTNSEICDKIFSVGLHSIINDFKDGKNTL